MNISVIICTRDRADDLRATLRSLDGVAVPDGCDCELLIIDKYKAKMRLVWAKEYVRAGKLWDALKQIRHAALTYQKVLTRPK